jgi:hypothetical protein
LVCSFHTITQSSFPVRSFLSKKSWDLTSYIIIEAGTAAQSPFVIAMKTAGVKGMFYYTVLHPFLTFLCASFPARRQRRHLYQRLLSWQQFPLQRLPRLIRSRYPRASAQVLGPYHKARAANRCGVSHGSLDCLPRDQRSHKSRAVRLCVDVLYDCLCGCRNRLQVRISF